MKEYKFTAKIQEAGSGGACVLFPYDVEQEFGIRGRIPVEVTYDSVPYKGTMIKYGRPEHMLPILKAIRGQIGKGPGDTVLVTVKRDTAVRSIEIPPAFKTALRKEGLLDLFERLSYTHRKEYVRWITEAKKEETRTARVAKALQMLHKGVKTPG